MNHFKFYNKEDLLYLTRLRRFETKLGERLQVLSHPDQFEEKLDKSSASYVLFGIPEDIGVKANYGKGGADSAWLPFLSSFLNMQSNDFLTGEEILLLGHFDFGDLQYLIENHARSEEEKIEAYRHAVNQIDEEVEQLSKQITAAGKIPIAIGGGHNNAYPLIKGSAKGLFKSGKIPLAQINVINLDAHTDFRPAEGRHSGNGFRYAEEDGYLQKYSVIGVKESYIQQNVWLDFVNNPFLDLISYEDIFLHEKRNFLQAVAHCTNLMDENYCGIDLDLDVIQDVLSSACASSGITVMHARQYVNFVAQDLKPAYLHICEGAAQLSDGRKTDTIGQLIGFLVADFVKARQDLKIN
ncbi:arginase family protein [Flavihumibacter sp. UBA7668]|uniref:arginase family protein n=1 Tax=Flavihumibacter sp. UBA7668 TaxID=1946542 RepID=UPI0025BA3C7E|nr:arginase family protein [Flavihumibacter sp. UBA7668]